MTGRPVTLRNGLRALVTQRVRCCEVFTLLGLTISPNGTAHDTWQGNGSWREDGAAHPLDIVRGLDEPAAASAEQGETTS